MAANPDAGAVDAAVMAALQADGALMALCPGGVYYDIARPGVTTFVIVRRFTHANNPNLFATSAGESYLYLVKAVIPGNDGTAARQAALRIRAVLHENGTLAAAGFALQRPVLEAEDVRYVEVDPANPDRRVQHWGGHYTLEVEWTA